MGDERVAKRIKTHDGASSLSSAAPGSTHQVFLSFRGVDTRTTFTDHLYNYLKDVGVETFRDNEKLHVGEKIGSDLMKAIEESRISIPIFSKGYASSKWCLREVTHMVKCMNDTDPEGRQRHIVCPVFYDVTPSVVRHQTGSFAEAFLKHTINKEVDVQKWKDALKEVCELKGWEKDQIANGHEAELIKKIVTEVCEKLKTRNVRLTDALVGMDRHIKEMTQLLDNGGNGGVRIVGIVGMGGIGKTTIAKFMYNKLCDQFRPQCSFVDDVREGVKRNNGCAELQKKLISDMLNRTVDGSTIDQDTFRDKKVLIVLDDVEDRDQLKEIFGGHASQLATREYFGSGSRIIVTTRNKDIFVKNEGDLIYEPGEMNDEDSLLLFCKHAFKETQPLDGFEVISREFVQTAAGLPLFLVVVGSMLFSKKRKEYWESTLEKLKTIPSRKVQERLKISYDALDDGQKQIFLDIACHFIGEVKTHAMYMWKDCEFFPDCEIDTLISLSLITIEKHYDVGLQRYMDVFGMHDHLRDLGRDIVKQENPKHPWQRSRLWSSTEARKVLDNQSGTEKVETFCYRDSYFRSIGTEVEAFDMNSEWNSDHIFSNEHFKGLSSLRYLWLEGSRLKGDFNGLVSNLRWFRWRIKYPTALLHLVKSKMPITNFCANKLVVLDLSESDIWDGWESWIQIKASTNLKVLNLTSCRYLTMLPECLWDMKSLLELNLSCTKIAELPEQGIGRLQKLEELDCSYCLSLEGQLPEGIGRLSSLRVLNLNYTKINRLPEDVWSLYNLRELNLRGTNIKKLPGVGIERLQKLEELDCSYCRSLEGQLPEGIERLPSLRVLNLNNTKINRLPEDVGSLCNLKLLILRGTNIKKLPGVGIERLQKLEKLDCSYCRSLEGELPEGIGRVSSLRVLNLESTQVDRLPEDVGSLCNLTSLNLWGTNIKKLPDVGIERLQKLEELNCSYCKSLEGQLPEGIGRLSFLRVLNLESTQVDRLPEDFGSLCSLRELKLRGTNIKKLPGVGIERLQKLEKLDCSYCRSLEGELPEGIGRVSSLRVLNLESTQVDRLPEDVGSLCILTSLNLCSSNIKKLPGVGIENLQKLEELDCSFCESLEGQLPEGIGRLSSLRVLNLNNTKINRLPEDVGSLCNLKKLKLSGTNIKKLPGVGIERLQKLEELNCLLCESLEGELPERIWSLSSLRILAFSGTKITGRLPKDISGLSNLEFLHLGPCEELQLPLEGLKLPLSLAYLSIPLTEASVNGVRGLVNLRELQFHKNVGYCCELAAEEAGVIVDRNNNNNGTPIIDMPRSLKYLTLYGLDDHVLTLDLSNCRMLRLSISYCFEMGEIKGLTSLEVLTVEHCPILIQLNLSNCKMLKELKISNCGEMREIKGLEVLTSLDKLIVGGCPLLMKPDLSNLKSLKSVIWNEM